MTDISTAFTPKSEPIIEFFQRPGVAFYIPLYQRTYSWDEENVKELLEDISQGVKHFLSDDGDIHFFGTVIKVVERNPEANIQPKDVRALPERIDNIIDGQQRISTFALLAAVLYQRLKEVSDQLFQSDAFTELEEVVTKILSQLLAVFAVDLQRGAPPLKPIVIRGAEDKWTLDGSDTDYRSAVSNYLAGVIRSIHTPETSFPSINAVKAELVRDNLHFMMEYIQENVEAAHLADREGNDFPRAASIVSCIRQSRIWLYERANLKETVTGYDGKCAEVSLLCSMVQLLAFCHYMLHRCCVVTIRAENEKWAYDMFQSLNATGTPLTAVETFKPTVVSRANQTRSYMSSIEATYFEKIDDFMATGKDAAEKTKITNEFLTTFALSYRGYSLARRFSTQKQWLDQEYTRCETPETSRLFVQRMSDVAIFQRHLSDFITKRGPANFGQLRNIADDERRLAEFCLLYLEKANHKMARTILSLFYSRVIDDIAGSSHDFVALVKAVAAFFTLWRSATPNSGLDDAYRKILGGKSDESISAISWKENHIGQNLTVESVKRYLRQLLRNRISSQSNWESRAAANLIYKGTGVKTVCRFALFITSKDVIADENKPGLMYEGAPGSTKEYWEPMYWRDRALSVEHIAPQEPGPSSQWDEDIYDDENYHKIGNLTLLPSRINKSVGNKPWNTKYVYYRHLAERSPKKLEELQILAQQHNVELQESSVKLLKETPVSNHMESIITIGIDGSWNNNVVQGRTKKLCAILWSRLNAWLD